MFPSDIKIEKGNFVIKWDDGTVNSVKLAGLRYNCPCAVCAADKDKKGETYIPLYNEKEVSVESVNLIGRYAIKVVWKDGHDTGIYDFNYLKTIMS